MDGAAIIARLEQPDADEQVVCDELRDSAPLPALAEALGAAQDGWTRMLVADLIGDRGDPAALAPLVGALDDPDERVRWAVADALRKVLLRGPREGALGAQRDAAGPGSASGAEREAAGAVSDAGAALLDRFEVEDAPEVRRPLASALGAARHRPALPALRATLDGDDSALVFCARMALCRIDGAPPVGPEEVVELLERPVEDGRPLTGRLLIEAPTGVLVGALEHARRPATRRALADLLGFRADAGALDALIAILEDPDSGVRASVADALGKLALAEPPPPPDALHRAGAAMLARFEREPSPGVRRTLASAVGATRHLPAAPALRRALGSDDPSLVRAARWGLHWLERTPPPA